MPIALPRSHTFWLQIIDKAGKRFFFTSFLTRDIAFKLISAARVPLQSMALDSSKGDLGALPLLEGDLANLPAGTRSGQGENHARPSTLRIASDDDMIPEEQGEEGEEDDDDANEGCHVWRHVSTAPSPSLSKGSKLLVKTTLPGTLRDVFDVFLSDASNFLEVRCHLKR